MNRARRRERARQIKPEVLGDVRKLGRDGRVKYVNVASSRVRKIAENFPRGGQLAEEFVKLLKYVVNPDFLFHGGCHNLSSVLYLRLKMLGFENAKLLLGEVHCSEGKFDHSWVELDGKVYDVAICAPCMASEGRKEGCFAGGPVFAGVDVGSMQLSQAEFGAASNLSLGVEAAKVLQLSLIEFLDLQREFGWRSMADILGQVYGVDGAELVKRHGAVKREWRNPSLNPCA